MPEMVIKFYEMDPRSKGPSKNTLTNATRRIGIVNIVVSLQKNIVLSFKKYST